MALAKNLAAQPISSLNLRPLITAKPDTPVRQAVQMMREKQLGCVVVVDEAGKPVGWFNEMGLTRLLLNDPADLDKPVGDLLETSLAVVKDSDPVRDATTQLLVGERRFIVVVDHSGKAIALSGERGITEYVADHFPRTVLTSEAGAKPYMETREGG